MVKANGKTELDPQALDVGHELPAAEGAAESEQHSATAPAPSVEDLKQEVEQLKSERDSLLDRLARLQAEFNNARKRQAREQQEFREYALADALKSLLPALDSFDHALAADSTGEDFRAGIELINRQLHDALAKLGVQPIAAQGERFDPNLHQAVQMVETTEAEENRVLEELQRGYRLKDRLLRPAMVRVARNPGK